MDIVVGQKRDEDQQAEEAHVAKTMDTNGMSQQMRCLFKLTRVSPVVVKRVHTDDQQMSGEMKVYILYFRVLFENSVLLLQMKCSGGGCYCSIMFCIVLVFVWIV